MADVTLSAEITARITDLERNLDRAVRDVRSAEGKIDNSNKNTNNSFSGIGKAIAGAFAVDRILSLGKAMLDITAKFEKYNAVLTNTLGSSLAAGASMDLIRDFAAKTPFAVDELTGAYIKLANQGFLPTANQLTQLGDLASSTGKTFDQLTEAILDAQQGEYERLKEFGIRAKDQGDKVIFTFKGVQTEVDKSSVAIREYITALGSAEGVTGSMAAISATLTGQISNLGDSWDALLVSFGNRTSGAFKTGISALNDYLNTVTKINSQLEAQEKFGKKQGFFEYIGDQLGSKLFGKKSQSEMIGEEFELRNKTFTDLANKLTAGAKTKNDFDKAIKGLAVEYNAEAKRLGKDKEYLAILDDAYKKAVAMVTAQQSAQEKQATGNFGRTKGRKAKPKEGFDKVQAEVTALEKQLQNSLIGGNVAEFDVNSPLAAKLREAQQRLDALKFSYDELSSGKIKDLGGQAGVTISDQPLNSQPEGINEQMQALSDSLPIMEAYTKFQARMSEYNEAVRDTTLELTETIAGGLANALEGIVTGGQNAFAAFGQFLAGLLIKIATAIAAAAALAAILSIVFPGFSIAKGVSNFSSLASSLSGIAGLGGLLGGAPRMASGGLVNKPTFAMIGEAGPEVVVPLNRLSEMGGGGNDLRLAYTVIPSGVMVQAYDNGKNQQGRRGR